MDMQYLLTYAGITLGSLVLYYLITQWVHQIHKRNRYMKAQIELLSKIAEKQGVAREEIEVITATAEKKENPLALASYFSSGIAFIGEILNSRSSS